MWRAIGLLVLVSDAISGKLTGENVCQEEHRYTINVTEYFVRNSTIRQYKWCMHVPPRCSFYTVKLVNDSRIVEKEVADLTDKCCPGYEEHKVKGICVRVCPDCVNGDCIEGKCSCFSGYKGNFCSTACSPSEWGPNCDFKCTCQHGSCDSKTGNCICPSGWTGKQCQLMCPDGFFGEGCQEECKCKMEELCHHVAGECKMGMTTTVTTERTTFSITNKNNILTFKNNGKFETDLNGLLSTASVSDVTENGLFVTEAQERPKINKKPMDNEMLERQDQINDDERYMSLLTTLGPVQIMKSSKAKVNAKEVSSISTIESARPQEENYLNDGARRGNINQPSVNKNDLVNSASAATAISVTIIIIAVLIVATNHFIRTRKVREETLRTKGVPTVSVYAQSIFHTPLPEPPTFENPVFITPSEMNSNGEGRFETRVVCSMNFPSHTIKESKEYLYDHPPSTGSYRAGLMPEPPDPDVNSMQTLPHAEPLYDEIPSGMLPTPVSQSPPSYKSSTLYMNTCGKTRL